MNMPVRAISENDERRSSLIRSLSDFTKQHRAAHWAGTFASFLEGVFPADARGIARSSHQYIWDMMRPRADDRQAFRCTLRGRALRHRRHDRARGRLLQGRGAGSRSRPAPAAAARAAVGRQVEHGHPAQARAGGIQPHRRRARSTPSTAARCTSRRCTSSRTPCAASSATPTASTSAASSARTAARACSTSSAATSCRCRCERIFISEAGPHRRRHLRAARPDHRRHRRPGRLGRPVQGRRVRRRRRPARLVVVGRGVRREPRHARDDRDPEGEARVPLPAAHAHPGEERQGVALPADPPRRDHPRAHQPRRVPQVPAGARERGAARPDGDHPGAVHPLLQGRGAHLPASSPRRPRRSARCTSTRTCCTPRRCSRS